ncbi:MAG: bifunctional aspartate kinase/homoserine dehydrogenase I [Ignavibacteriaceae bacterium]|nr:bifunctional aspartate kinase/homoserine dehydrogenase I [Ignavibacteriaceae bacterium]
MSEKFNRIRILKFGGSSVGSPARIREVIQVCKDLINNGETVSVVFSAFQGVTDTLIRTAQTAAAGDHSYVNEFESLKKRHTDACRELAGEDAAKEEKFSGLLNDLEQVLYGIYLLKELTPRSLDYVMSFGERLSCLIISEAFNASGQKAVYTDARLLVKTDAAFGYGKVNFQETNRLIREYFAVSPGLNIITGFIGSTANNETTTLGRGGSDYTAAIFGAALRAEEVQIWTDVDGVLTADPRKVKAAFTIDSISYYEAMEMSHFGAKVLYPPTIHPVLHDNIPIRIKNTLNPSHPGTLITGSDSSGKRKVTGISSIDKVTLFKISVTGLASITDITSRIFSVLSSRSISALLVSQASSEQSICFSVLPENTERVTELVQNELRHEMADGYIREFICETGVSLLAVVGENLLNNPGISGQVFQALGKNGISILAAAQGSSRLNISTVIKTEDLSKALNAIHDTFFLSDRKRINLFIAGTGLIGRTLFTQIRNQLNFLLENLNTDMRIIGIVNTRRMLIDQEGIDVNEWEERFEREGVERQNGAFFSRMISSNLPNSIFVDCTSSSEVMEKYLQVLSASISIVTPNKKANSSSYDYYLQLKKAARQYNVKFLYETNVGAGLPVINTINDLVLSGDSILRIEGVLSGTLSYIFNKFSEGGRFSDILKESHKMGYTEPDPREDLRGIDAARKLLILVREGGYRLEPEDIQTENLIPPGISPDITSEEFLEILPRYDHIFDELREKARSSGGVLRYIASWEEGKASVKLRVVDKTHPFYCLSSNDNVISLKTVYYNERPMIVQGPGAGARVTSGGILADIVRIANYLQNNGS